MTLVRTIVVLLMSVGLYSPALTTPKSKQEPAPESIGFNAGATEYCLDVMSGFPDDATSRFTFFHLVELLHEGSKPDVYNALDHYSGNLVQSETPLVEVLEYIADPVMRQALPNEVLAHFNHLVRFDLQCASYIDGQVEALTVIEPTTAEHDFRNGVLQDALFLRYIMIDAFYQLSAHENGDFQEAVNSLQRSAESLESNKRLDQASDELDDFMEGFLAGYTEDRRTQSAAVLEELYDPSQVQSDRSLLQSMNMGARTQGYENVTSTILYTILLAASVPVNSP